MLAQYIHGYAVIHPLASIARHLRCGGCLPPVAGWLSGAGKNCIDGFAIGLQEPQRAIIENLNVESFLMNCAVMKAAQ